MLTTDSDDLAQKLGRLRSHGMTSLTWDRHKGHAWSYDVVDLGYNYRIDEIRAALGLAQLAKIEKNNECRRHLSQLYRSSLQGLGLQVEVPFHTHGGKTSAHIMPILLPKGTSREQFMGSMKEQGIQTSFHYPPVHTFTAYQSDTTWNLPVTEEVASREVTLPLYPALTDKEILLVTNAISQALHQA
jgi:dTDP-4-amino-4,6-dideoxygalactose transaminase